MRMEESTTIPDDRLADLLAPPMFYLSLLFLMLLAALLVLWIDVPRVVESPELQQLVTSERPATKVAHLPPPSAENQAFEETAFIWGKRVAVALLLLWPVFVAEQAVHYFMNSRGGGFDQKYPYWWVYCLIPPLRMCARHRGNRQTIWLPRLGWQVVDHHLQRRLERAFSIPMIWIALLILPVLGLQAVFQEKIADYPGLRLALHFGAGLIWFAFATEFIVMVSVADKKLKYCKKHWLDLVIVLLPLVSFLRTLRFLRITRALQFGRLQQLTRLVRVYRLRGVAMRAFRALLVLEVVHRLLRTKPAKRIEKLEEQYLEKQRELALLRHEIDELRLKHGLECSDE